jgi:hypothetical protein
MLVRFKDHLRYNAIAYVALFIVLGGTAMALPGKGSVTSNDIAKKAVKTKNIAKKAVKSKNIAKNTVKSKNLADQAVTTTKLDDEAVTGAKADEASFQGLIQGDGEQFMTSVTVDGVGFLPDPKPVLASVPSMGVVELLGCFGAPNYSIRVRLLSFDDSLPFLGIGTLTYSELPAGFGPAAISDQDGGFFSGGGGSPLIASAPGGSGTAAHWDYSLSRITGAETAGAHVSVDGYNDHGISGPVKCHVTATVETQE